MTSSGRVGAVLLLPMAGGACFTACDATTTQPGEIEPALFSAPDGMVPFLVQEAAWTPADANPTACEPTLAGVVLPDRMLISSVISGSSCTVTSPPVRQSGGLRPIGLKRRPARWDGGRAP